MPKKVWIPIVVIAVHGIFDRLPELISSCMSFNGVRVRPEHVRINAVPYTNGRNVYDLEVHITTGNSSRRVDNASVAARKIFNALRELYPSIDLWVTVSPTANGSINT